MRETSEGVTQIQNMVELMYPNTDPAYLSSQGLSKTFPERFFEKVKITPDHWLWIGSTKISGHGMIQRNEGSDWKILAHRAAWILFVGPIPIGKMVLHKCPSGTVPSCVNPDHLYLGNQAENMRDMTREGRCHFSKAKYRFKGESNPKAKLTHEIVRMIRSEYTGERGQKASLSRKYGVHPTTLAKIVHNVFWTGFI